MIPLASLLFVLEPKQILHSELKKQFENRRLQTLEGYMNQTETHTVLFFLSDRNGQTYIYKPMAGL